LLAWLFATVSCGWISYRVFRIRPCLPAGVVLARQQAPALFQLMEATGAHYGSPVIDRIMITDAYQLDIVKTPLHVLPFGATRTLLIGLPLLQSLSGARLQCALARRLGQFSGRANRLLNGLYALRSVWPAWRDAASGSDPACLPVRALFSLYAPLYTTISTAAARLDELQADSYAMELFSDEDVLDAVTTDSVHRLFLQESYWPAIRKLREQDAAIATTAGARIATVLHAGLQSGTLPRWIEQAMTAEQQWDDPWPSLVRRIENIGHAQASMLADAGEPAADAYLVTSRSKLEAALVSLPPPQRPQPRPWPADWGELSATVRSATDGLLRRLKTLAHTRQHAGEAKH